MSDAFRDDLAAALSPAYALGRELGGGGMSRVFLAEERALGRTVVVKVLPPDLAAGINRERFRREIQLAARLQHPHIVPLLAAGEVPYGPDGQGGSLYYTMPFIEGESLRTALARGRAFSVREVARILHDVVEALAYAHARGVVHRDVKPGNVLLQGTHALVTDFGVAKALSAARHGDRADAPDAFVTILATTSTGLAIGTPAYMAPEQLAADPGADHRVDLYAAGLLAYELCTGRSPFVADSPRATLAAQLTVMPDPLHLVRPDVPPALSAVVMRCLAKEPAQRPDTADALLAELDAALSGTPAGSLDQGPASAPLAFGPAPTTPTSGTAPIPAAAPTVAANLPVPWEGGPSTPGQGTLPATVATPAYPSAARRHATLVAAMVAGGALALLGGVLVARGRPIAPPPPAAPPVVAPAAATAGAPARTELRTPAAASAAPARPRLTRDDSLAIAAAVERRLAEETARRRESEQPPMDPAQLEAIRARTWARYADSVRIVVGQRFPRELQAELRDLAREGGPAAPNVPASVLPPGARIWVAPPAPGAAPIPPTAAAAVARLAERIAPPAAGVRRVVVLDPAEPGARPELRGAGGTVGEALRRSLAAAAGYELFDPGATRELQRLGLSPDAIAAVTHAGAVVSTMVYRRDSTSVEATLLIHDAARHFPHSARARRPIVDGDLAASVQQVAGVLGEALPRQLERVRW